MITDEEIAQLPEDPELAFVEFERILRTRMQEKEGGIAQQQWGDAGTYQLEYINKVLAAARAYDVDALKNWKVPPAADCNMYDRYRQFTADVDHFTIQIRRELA